MKWFITGVIVILIMAVVQLNYKVNLLHKNFDEHATWAHVYATENNKVIDDIHAQLAPKPVPLPKKRPERK